MNILFTGSRDWPEDDKEPIELILDRAFWGERGGPYHIYVGDCPTGVDKIVREKMKWVNSHAHVPVTLHVFKADWDRYGKAAGPKRNRDMVETAGSGKLYAFHASRWHYEKQDSGTNHCAWVGEELGFEIHDIVRRT